MSVAYQLNDLRYFYGKKQALFLSDVSIQAEQITALIGSNGSGKSTLLNVLGFLQQSQGEVFFFGERVTKKKFPVLLKKVGFIPQKPFLLKGTVVDNLMLVLKFHAIKQHRMKKINAVLECLNIAHLALQQANSLSGGELQKVALARAIVTEPLVLLMDEPFSYLDQSSIQGLEVFIREYVQNTGKTLIFSTHNRLQGLAIAQQVIALFAGRQVNTPLINVFHGVAQGSLFDTGKLTLLLGNDACDCQHVSIDPVDIVLSVEPLICSMRNQYQGLVSAVANEAGNVRVTVVAGEIFQVLITSVAFHALTITLGQKLWISFKATAVRSF